jgi:hypothetical protein
MSKLNSMKRYKGISGLTGVEAFLAGKDFIRIKFKTGPVYLYNYKRPGRLQVEEMKRLAKIGKGLTTYINQFVRDQYAEKLG